MPLFSHMQKAGFLMKLLLHYCDKLTVMLYDLEINFSIYFHILFVKK